MITEWALTDRRRRAVRIYRLCPEVDYFRVEPDMRFTSRSLIRSASTVF